MEKKEESQKGKRWQAWLLLLSVFLLVGSGLVYELLIASFSSHLQGDSIYQFSLTIGLFLSAMGIGSYWTQRFRDRLVERLLEVQLILALFGGMTIAVLGVSDLLTRNYFFICHLWTIFLGSMIGFVLPISVRIIEETMPLRTLLARVMLFDYIGALAGSLLFPWWLLPSFGFANASLFVGGICLFSFGLLMVAFGSSIEGRGRKLGLAAVIGLLLAGGWGRIESYLEMLIEQQTPGMKKVTILRSRYQEIRFVRYFGSYFLTLNRHPQFSSQDERRYHEALVHPAMAAAKERKRVLILGGGDGLAVRDIWGYHDVEEVVMVDLDPAMTDFGTHHPVMQKLNEKAMLPPKERPFCLYEEVCPKTAPRLRFQKARIGPRCPALPDETLLPAISPSCHLHLREAVQRPRLRVLNTDAWKFLEADRSKFSVILSDLPDATNISLSKLYSLEFYRMIRQRLSPGGALAIQSTSVAPGYRRAYWCIVGTVQAAGFHVKNYAAWVPSFGMHTSFLLASDHPLEPSTFLLTPETRYLHQEMMSSLFWFPKDIQSVPTRINRIDTHILLRYLIKN